MKVYELIDRLKLEPQDAEVYYGRFCTFLTEDLERSKEITSKERLNVYDIDFEFKTVYHFSVRTGEYIPYTGVIFEID